MRFSLRNLLICVTILFLLLPAMRPIAEYVRREREKAQARSAALSLQIQIERLKKKLYAERAARIYVIGQPMARIRLQEAELRRLDEENERLVKSQSEVRRLLGIEDEAINSQDP